MHIRVNAIRVKPEQRLPDMKLDPGAEQPAMKGWLMRAYRPLHVVFSPGLSSA